SFAAGLLRGRNRWEWWTNFSLTIAVTSWSFVVGRWDLVGYPVRFVIPILVLIAGLIGWRHVRRLGIALPRGSVRNLSVILHLVLSLVCLAQTGMGIAGHYT